MVFKLDERIESSSVFLTDWPLSSVYLKNEAAFPWLILVPRMNNVQELYELDPSQQQALMREITELSRIVNDYFHPDKLNVGALGNIVSQLHVHVIARFKQDIAWPQSVWQADLASFNYTEEEKNRLVSELKKQLNKSMA